MPRTKTYPEDLRDRLVAAALERLRTHASEHVSLRELAARCGTSTNAIYSIFGGKDALIEAVIELARAELLAHVVLFDEPDESLDAFGAAGRRYRAWARRHPDLYRLIVEDGGPIALGEQDMARVIALVESLMAQGVLRRTDPTALIITVWTSLHGFTLFELNRWPHGSEEADYYYARTQQQLAEGLLTPGMLAVLAAQLTPEASA